MEKSRILRNTGIFKIIFMCCLQLYKPASGGNITMRLEDFLNFLSRILPAFTASDSEEKSQPAVVLLESLVSRSQSSPASRQARNTRPQSLMVLPNSAAVPILPQETILSPGMKLSRQARVPETTPGARIPHTGKSWIRILDLIFFGGEI